MIICLLYDVETSPLWPKQSTHTSRLTAQRLSRHIRARRSVLAVAYRYNGSRNSIQLRSAGLPAGGDSNDGEPGSPHSQEVPLSSTPQRPLRALS